ncbi:hypothetical protein [Polymorphobacter megasporae]|uniref:hypothetical protein n=1 Tax=Glacieibacterium megasporae TaxID=2835787 RepID=UPI001C1E5296|nr:hypothetical protein [Polymorphobacter megasporae]UAJ10643.1 hypothetical protein KTC28_02485 [Polymorphobacter megasporae]
MGRIPSGRLRPDRDTVAARRRLLLVTTLAKLIHLPRAKRTAGAIRELSAELAVGIGLRKGLSAKNFQRDDALNAIYQRARFGPRIIRERDNRTAVVAASEAAASRAVSARERELEAILKATKAELRDARIMNVVECVREFRRQIGR